MTQKSIIANQRAIDDLAFDPLAKSKFATFDGEKIHVKTPYSEEVAALLRGLPNSKWDHRAGRWTMPATSAPALRKVWSLLHDLAQKAEAPWPEERPKIAVAQQPVKQRRHSLLRRECINPQPGRPFAVVSIERISTDAGRFLGIGMRCGVRQIWGLSADDGWVGPWLRGRHDYAQANAKASRGVRIRYELFEGPIYEIHSPQSWKAKSVFFAKVFNADLVRITEDEVRKCLES